MKISNEQKLLELKKRILEKTNKSSAVLFELQELNKSFNNLIDLILKSDKVNEIKDNTDFVSSFDELSKRLDLMSKKIESLDFSKMPTPNVIVPEKREVKVINIKDAQTDKVKIDWENQPKDKKDGLLPVKWLYKALESVVSDFFTKVIGFMGKVSEYIKEPDRLIVTDKEITEFYGTKKINYRIKRDGIKTEIYREN